MYNKIYDKNIWPKYFGKAVCHLFFPKKVGTKKYEEHGVISIKSHAAKILLRGLYQRIVRIIKENVDGE